MPTRLSRKLDVAVRLACTKRDHCLNLNMRRRINRSNLFFSYGTAGHKPERVVELAARVGVNRTSGIHRAPMSFILIWRIKASTFALRMPGLLDVAASALLSSPSRPSFSSSPSMISRMRLHVSVLLPSGTLV